MYFTIFSHQCSKYEMTVGNPGYIACSSLAMALATMVFIHFFKCISNCCPAIINLCPRLWNRRVEIYGEPLNGTT